MYILCVWCVSWDSASEDLEYRVTVGWRNMVCCAATMPLQRRMASGIVVSLADSL